METSEAYQSERAVVSRAHTEVIVFRARGEWNRMTHQMMVDPTITHVERAASKMRA